MRRAFTLIEIIVVVAILAIMATAAVVGVRSGQDAARVKGATRDIMAAIRHARSMALVMMQPAIITYSTERDGDEVCAKITVDGAKLMSSGSSDTVQTLSGEIVRRDGSKVDDAKKTAVGEDEPKELLGDSGGDSVEDVLFAPISSEVVRGVRIKVLTGDELAETTQTETEQKSANRISVFSNVDYLLGKYKEKKTEEAKAASEQPADQQASPANGSGEDQEPVSLVWEANGRCDPHRVLVYLDGKNPESGLCINIDRFGAAKVVSDERD